MDDSKKVSTNMEDDIARDLGIKEVQNAATADAAEHNMTLREAFIAHRKAIFWSMALSGACVDPYCFTGGNQLTCFSLIMEGYDVVVIGSFYGQRTYMS